MSAFFSWLDEPQEPDIDVLMRRIQIEGAWYTTWYKWAGEQNIRAFELKRSKKNLGRLCALYWVTQRRKGAVHGI